MNGIQTTDELLENLTDEVGVEASGSWDAIADEAGTRPTLKKFTAHDDRVVLKFTNGHKVRIFHAELEGRIDGDLWDVTPLGWS